MDGATFTTGATARRPLRIATAGSVDDGKSTLIGRLLYDAGLLADDQVEELQKRATTSGAELPDFAAITDGLTDEREQGITIDVAYRYVDTPQRRLVIADVPGHEQYTRNMVTGASTADAVIILVDASRGTTTQTWRHLCISLLLGIPDIVVAVNKMDLVGYAVEKFESIADEVRQRVVRFNGVRTHVVPLSARNGENVVHSATTMPWYDGPPLIDLVHALPLETPFADRPFRLAVQYVTRPRAGSDLPRRAYMGRISSGNVAVGDTIMVLPSGRRARVAGIEALGVPVTTAAASQSVSLFLDREVDIARGDVIADEADPPATLSTFDAVLFWLAQRPHDPAKRYILGQGSRTVRARISSHLAGLDVTGPRRAPPPTTLDENDIAIVRIETQSPIACDHYRQNSTEGSFILIDEHTNETVAAGLIGADVVPDNI